ncbi:WGR domain-containing protein, partial [Corallococcus sp. AB050B]
MRRFEFVDGNSSKFWVPELQGATFIVTYGRIGTAGQRKEKVFPDEDAAQKEYNKKVAEKVREGYAEVTSGEAPPAPPNHITSRASERWSPRKRSNRRAAAGVVAGRYVSLTACVG